MKTNYPTDRGICYHGKQMDIEEYFTVCMKELGFYDEDGKPNDKDCVKGYYRSEAEFNILADYESSCGLETAKEQEFVRKIGYEPEDFINKEDLNYEQEADL